MRRRRFVILLGGAAIWPLTTRAQRQAIPVLGWLSPATAQSYEFVAPDSPGPAQLRAALAKYGLVEGTNIRVEMRLAEGRIERLPALAKELVENGATILLAFGEPAAKAAQAATAILPIICVADDLVDSGIAASLSKPGTNITGVSILATELDAKKIQVLKELLPDAKRFGILNDPTSSGPLRPMAMAETARRLGVELTTTDVRGLDELALAFQTLQAAGIEGINVVASATLNSMRRQIGQLSMESKIPMICQFRQSVIEAGCLASYGITIPHLYVLAASQIAKLLQGTKPENLPIQQPTKLELVVSLKNAQALGLTLPQALLARADEVIE